MQEPHMHATSFVHKVATQSLERQSRHQQYAKLLEMALTKTDPLEVALESAWSVSHEVRA